MRERRFPIEGPQAKPAHAFAGALALLALAAGAATLAARPAGAGTQPPVEVLQLVPAEGGLRAQVRDFEISETAWNSALAAARGFQNVPDSDRAAYLDRELAPELSRWFGERAGGPEVSWIPEIRGSHVLALNGVRVQKCKKRVKREPATGADRMEQVCYVRDRLVSGEEREYLRVW